MFSTRWAHAVSRAAQYRQRTEGVQVPDIQELDTHAANALTTIERSSKKCWKQWEIKEGCLEYRPNGMLGLHVGRTVPVISTPAICLHRDFITPRCEHARSWDRTNGQQKPFVFSDWQEAIHTSSQTDCERYGTPMSLPEAFEMVYRSLTKPPAVLVTQREVKVNTELRMVDERVAIFSVHGWKFRAGQTRRDRCHVWEPVSPESALAIMFGYVHMGMVWVYTARACG